MNELIQALLLCLQCIIWIVANASPIGKQVEYAVEAKTIVGNNLEGDIDASWLLISTLTIQSFDGYKVMQLKDVQSGIHNGPKTNQSIPLYPEKTYLSVPFVVNYNKSFWSINSLSFNPDEPIWSGNIKKAIGSVFQFKTDVSTGELVSEKNIFGDCRVKYEEISPENLTLVKSFQQHSCRNKNQYGNPNDRWQGPKQKTTKKYTFSNNFTEFPLNISINSITTYKTIINDRVKQQIEQRITFNRLSVKLKSNQIDTSNCTLIKDPVFEIDNPKQQIIDLSLIDKFNKEAKKLVKQLKLKYSEPINEENLQTIGNLYNILSTADFQNYTVKEFCELVIKHNEEKAETNNKNPFQLNLMTYSIVASLIQYTGNDQFIIKFVKEVVNSNNITEIRAKFLTEFPDHLKNVNEELLEDLAKLLEMNNDIELNDKFSKNDYSKMVGRDTFIISFSRLVARMYNYIISFDDHFKEESHYKRLILNYVEKYYQLYLETKCDSTKLSYILGLGNMGVLATDRLLDITKNRSESRHFRTVAMYSLEQTLQKENLGIFTNIWPIVQDAGNPFELRVAALSVLLNSNIDFAEFHSIGWYLNKTSDEPTLQHLYNYYITFLESHTRIRSSNSETNDSYDYHQNRKPLASTKGLLTGLYYIRSQDSPDNENLLSEMNLHVVANPITNFPYIIRLNFKHKHDTTKSSYTLHLKLEGLDRIIKFDSNDRINEKAIQTLLWMLKINRLKPNFVPEQLHVEIIFYKDDKSIFSFYSDNDDNAIYNKIYKYYFEELFNIIFLQNIHSAIQTYYYPSALGTQIILNSRDEKVWSGDYDIEKVKSPSDMIDFISTLKLIKNDKIDLQSENVLLDINLGVAKIKSLQSTINLNLNYSENENFMKWKDDDIYFDVINKYKHALYIDEVKDKALQKFCPECKRIQFYNLPETENVNIAKLRTWSKIININAVTTKKSVSNILPTAMQKMYIKNWAIPLAKPFVIAQYIIDYFYYYPEHDTYSITAKTLPALTTPNWTKLQFGPFQKLNNSDFNISFSLTQFQQSDNQIINQYNVNLNNIGDEINFNYFDKKKTSELQITTKIVSSSNASYFDDIFCSTAAESTEIVTSIDYINYEDTNDFVELDIQIILSVTEDHEKQVLKSKNYEICLKDTENSEIPLHTTPPTRSCYLVCVDLSTYDNYTYNLIPRRISNRFNNIVNAIMHKFDDKFVAKTKDISNVSLTYSSLNSTVYLNINNDIINVTVNVPQYLQPKMLLKPKNKLEEQLMFGSLGIDSICILTPQYIKTFVEETVQSYGATSFIGLIECNDKPRAAILIKKSYKKLDFKLWFDEHILTTNKMDSNKIEIVLNGQELSDNIDYENFQVAITNQSVAIKTNKFDLTYNLDYLAIRISSMNINKMCGMCSTGLLTATNEYSFNYLK